MTTEPKAEGVEAVAMWRAPKHGGGWMYFDHEPTHMRDAQRLYTHPTPAAVEALARADVEYDAAHIEYLDALPDDYYTPQGQCYLADDHPAQVRWDAARQRRSAALAHREIAALLKETK